MRVAFYKGTRPKLQGVYNRGVRAWTRSPYSHCEIIFSDGLSASSSYLDGGVRFKLIEYDPDHWDFLEIASVEAADERAVREWFMAHQGSRYDLMGNLGFVIGFFRDGSDKYSCAESIAAALGYTEAWRYSPAILYSVLKGRHD